MKNHRIVSDDLRRPGTFVFYMAPATSIVGRYVKTSEPILSGQPVPMAALSERPDMQLPNKMFAVAFPLSPDSRLINLLDVGSPVVLLGQDPLKPIAATVHAIFCDTMNADIKNCYPILRIEAAQSQFVPKNLELRLAPRENP
jgi:hypothetical protein